MFTNLFISLYLLVSSLLSINLSPNECVMYTTEMGDHSVCVTKAELIEGNEPSMICDIAVYEGRAVVGMEIATFHYEGQYGYVAEDSILPHMFCLPNGSDEAFVTEMVVKQMEADLLANADTAESAYPAIDAQVPAVDDAEVAKIVAGLMEAADGGPSVNVWSTWGKEQVENYELLPVDPMPTFEFSVFLPIVVR